MKILLAALTSILFLAGCEMQQNPLAGKPETIQNGQPPEAQKPLPEKPMDKEALQIDAPEKVFGVVGGQLKFNITGRVMDDHTDFVLEVRNMADFEGATFEPTSGEFTWTPDKKSVGTQPSSIVFLRVRMSTIPTAQVPVISVVEKQIPLTISNSYSKPVINTVTGPDTVTQGNSTTFNVTVMDIDAFHANNLRLVTADCSDYYAKSLSPFVSIYSIDGTTTPNSYKASIRLNLNSVDDLPTGTYCFGLVAVSQHGVSSDVFKKSFQLEAKIKNTRSTMEIVPVMSMGQMAKIAFAIYDPSGQGEISMSSIDDINAKLPGSSLGCTQGYSTKYQLDCSGFIDATQVTPGTYRVDMMVENKNTKSKKSITTKHTLSITVKAANP